MDRDSERDEAITEERIAGKSVRALAKLHNCSGTEIEAAIDRKLNYELDQRQRLRLVKLSVGRIESLMSAFYERATKDRDVSAGVLCVKLEERLALLLGLDHPQQQRLDVYQVEPREQPSDHEQIKNAIMTLSKGPNWRSLVDERLQDLPANGNGNGSPEPQD